MRLITTIGALAAIASIAGAQAFNLDFEDTAGVGGGLPSSAFGAAGMAGNWHPIGLGMTNNLINTSNVATGVSVDVTALGMLSNNTQGYAGDDLLLMGDIADGPSLITFTGLADGPYDVWVYAQAPDSATFFTDVTINGNTQTVGGAWGGTYVQGNTHSFHTGVVVAGGTMSITLAVNSGFASLNGLQIAPVPEPATFVALGIGALGLLVIRRKR
jgi:hypothetical protein